MSLVEKARTLAVDLHVHRTAHDTHKQLDPSVVSALRASGILDALLPKELGGHELAPAAYVEMLEALATGDSATAWVAMTATTSTMLAPYLTADAARAIWHSSAAVNALTGDRDHSRGQFLAGIFAPGGTLSETNHLSGKWSYASGSRHADWFVVGALSGKRHVLCFVPKSDVRIVDNWDTLGLAGTGSHDLAIDAVAIPQERIASVFERPRVLGVEVPLWPQSALYRLPLFGLLATGIAACGLGIARSALGHAFGKLKSDAPSPVLQRYAELRAQLDAARAYTLATCHDVYARAATGALDAAARGELRLCASYVSERCAEVVRGAFHAVGGAAARQGNPVGNALRDIEMLNTHRMVQSRILAASGRALLGLDGVPPDL